MAWGVLAYEVLTGTPPFVRDTPQTVMAAHVSAAPPPLVTLGARIPQALEQVVMRCLEKEQGARYQSGEELLAAVEALVAPGRASSLGARMAAATAVILVAAGAVFAWQSWRQERWVRMEAIPQIERLVEAERTDSAFELATLAISRFPRDSSLIALLDRFTDPWLFCSEPKGAQVYRAPFDDTTHWQRVGETPTDTIWLPPFASRLRFEKAGVSIARGGCPGLSRERRGVPGFDHARSQRWLQRIDLVWGRGRRA